MFKERVKRTILGVSGHGYAVLAVDEAGVMRGTSSGYGWRQAKSRDGVRTGFSTKAVRLFGALGRDRIRVKAVERTNSETFVEFLKELRQEYGRLIILLDKRRHTTGTRRQMNSSSPPAGRSSWPTSRHTPRNSTQSRSSGGCSRECLRESTSNRQTALSAQ